MAGLTVQEIINQFRQDINDEVQGGGSPKYSDQKILTKGFNAFGRDIAELSREKDSSTVLNTVSGTREYAYPDARWWFPVSAQYRDNGSNTYIPIPFLKFPNAQAYNINDDTDTGSPQFLYLLNNKINIYPMPDGIYNIDIVIIKKFSKLTLSDLTSDFEDFFDSSYEDIIQNYTVSKVLPSGDRLAKEAHERFRETGGDWDRIRRIESKKLDPFNAKNRRTRGAKINNTSSDYGLAY